MNAQAAPPATRAAPTFAVWTAFAGNEPLDTRMGDTHDRDLLLVGLRARWLASKSGRFEVAYTADFLPAVVSTGIPAYTFVSVPPLLAPSCQPSQGCTQPDVVVTEMHRKIVYGAGAAPVGGEVRFHAAGPLSFVLRGSAGVIYFSRAVPDPDEPRLNFILDIGAGGEVRFSRRLAMTAAYRLDHISNAGRGPVNPGMNSRMIELGLNFLP